MGNVRMRAEQINYGASNVKVALDDLDPMDLIALSERMDAIEAWKATVKAEEKTGAEVTFTNALALPAVSLSTEIEASQDLHGYDYPWVGGAGKNKLPNNNAQNTEVNGITVTVDSQGVIDLDGTASELTNIYTQGTGWGSGAPLSTLVNEQTYTWGYGKTDTEMGNVRYPLYGLKNGNVVFSAGGNATIPFTHSFTYNSDIDSFFCYIRIPEGTQLNHFKLYPQIEQGTSETTFAPYSNICPISGRTAVTITDYDSESNTATVTVQLGQTVYGGSLNVTSGELTVTHANIASYNGETIGEPWISSMDEYTEGGTPTTGAQVVYPLAAPTTIQLTPEQLTMLKGYNRLSSDGGGDITVEAYTGAAWGGDEA